MNVLCVDVGSTFTKAVLVQADSGEVLATAACPTSAPEVLDAMAAVQSATEAAARGSARGRPADEVLVCSSAGGGLRLAVVGYERLVTAEAGYRVALSAGGRVVHLSSGLLDPAGVEALRAARPDLIVLVGGTDGGNSDVVLENARRLGIARLPVPVVLAANADVADLAAAELRRRGRKVTVTANVLPQIGVLDPLPARSAIREAFLAHVIGGKGLSRRSSRLHGRSFAELVRAPTPDAVLTGVGLLAGADDVLLVDVGGATTDVYSVRAPTRTSTGTGTGTGAASPSAPGRQVVEPLWHARTVEGDLGVRSSARGVVDAALAESLLTVDDLTGDDAARLTGDDAARLAAYADLVSAPGADPGYLPAAPYDDRRLAALAALIAVRRHGRPARPGLPPLALREVGWVIGSGGVLRAADPAARAAILGPLLSDHAGGWAVPDRARLAVDVDYTLFAAGLMAAIAPEAAAALARAAVVPVSAAF